MNMKQLANNLQEIFLRLESEFGMKKNFKLIMLIMFLLNKKI